MVGIINAGVMKLADMQDLGSCVARRAGSSPVARTKKHIFPIRGKICFFAPKYDILMWVVL